MQEQEEIKEIFYNANSNPRLDNIFVLISYFIFLIPFAKKIYTRNFNLSCKLISILINKDKVESAYKILTYCLKSSYYRSNKNNNDKWWFFMRIAIACLQQEQLQKFLIRPKIEDELIDLGINSPHEKYGYDASYCFIGFALWSFERGLTKVALQHAEVASGAFELWGYPDYLLGWFNLFNEKSNSVDYFCQAVAKDWNMLQRIRNDPTCKMFPDIVKKVSQKILIANTKKIV